MPHKPKTFQPRPKLPEGQTRPNAYRRGYNLRWRRCRLAYLGEHPLCVLCEKEGRVTAAEVVDHIRDHKGDQTLFWDENNWQALCKRCHDSKTATQQ